MTGPLNIKELRAAVRSHLQMAGFMPRSRGAKMPPAWVLPSEEVERVFFPHEIRRSWGVKLSGTLAIELPPLRRWLSEAGGSPGIFRDYFVSYHLANDDLLSCLDAAHGKPPPVADWIGQIADRFTDLPDTIDELARTYRKIARSPRLVCHADEQTGMGFSTALAGQHRRGLARSADTFCLVWNVRKRPILLTNSLASSAAA